MANADALVLWTHLLIYPLWAIPVMFDYLLLTSALITSWAGKVIRHWVCPPHVLVYMYKIFRYIPHIYCGIVGNFRDQSS